MWRRLGATRLSPLSWIFVVASIAVYAAGSATVVAAHPLAGAPVLERTGVGVHAVFSGVVAVLSVYLPAAASLRGFRLASAARTVLTVGILALHPHPIPIRLAYLLTCTAGYALYDTLRHGIAASALAAAGGTGISVSRIVAGVGLVEAVASANTASGPPTGPLLVAAVPAIVELLVVGVSTAALFLYVENRERSIRQDREIDRLRSTVTRLSDANLGYQRYASEAELRSQVHERNRITRELHDIIGYAFVNNTMMLEAALSKIHKEPDVVRELIAMARENLDDAQGRIRAALYLLRSAVPTESTLAYIHRLVDTFEVATEVRVRVDYTNCPDRMPEAIEEFVVFFVQESLVNAFKHGRATAIHVHLHRDAGVLTAAVSDNGVGLGSTEEGIGLRGMRERLASLDGELAVRDLGAGVSLVAKVPFRVGESR